MYACLHITPYSSQHCEAHPACFTCTFTLLSLRPGQANNPDLQSARSPPPPPFHALGDLYKVRYTHDQAHTHTHVRITVINFISPRLCRCTSNSCVHMCSHVPGAAPAGTSCGCALACTCTHVYVRTLQACNVYLLTACSRSHSPFPIHPFLSAVALPPSSPPPDTPGFCTRLRPGLPGPHGLVRIPNESPGEALVGSPKDSLVFPVNALPPTPIRAAARPPRTRLLTPS